jgi:hypothetical protein
MSHILGHSNGTTPRPALAPAPADDRHVFVGMPGYGHLTASAARGFWRATRLPDRQVWYQYHEGSLLAANFNALLVTALNLVRQGRRIDYFAMQHADVEPQDWWLDTLIDEMEAGSLDVLGVVVPIKDTHGLTSLALDRPDGDPWRPYARLTMKEVFRLPETFTSEDIGHPLLLNTGLWAWRFDPAWLDKGLHFTINDRIVYSTTAEAYVAQCEPEDWNFSRQLHRLGLRIGATRKVRVTHRGDMAFSNGHPWGDQDHDAAWIDATPLPEPPPDRFIFPDDIDGWLLPSEGEALAGLARGKDVLEIGSYCGLSTICMARTADFVVAVDTHDGRGTPTPKNTIDELCSNLSRYGVLGNVDVLRGTFADLAKPANGESAALGEHWYPGGFDLAFIDGAHDLASVQNDIACALPLLAPGGLLAFHDYRCDGHPDVTVAVDLLLEQGGELLSLTDSLAVVRPPAAVPVPSHPEA